MSYMQIMLLLPSAQIMPRRHMLLLDGIETRDGCLVRYVAAIYRFFLVSNYLGECIWVTPAVREEKAAMQNETENCKNRVNEKAKWYSLFMIAYSHVNQFKHGQWTSENHTILLDETFNIDILLCTKFSSSRLRKQFMNKTYKSGIFYTWICPGRIARCDSWSLVRLTYSPP